MSIHESASNLIHTELTQAFSRNVLDPEKAKFLLVHVASQNLLSGPTATIRDVVELLCAAHAAGKDINIFRLALVQLDDMKGEESEP